MLNSLLISIYRLYIKRAKDFDKHLGTFFRIFKDLEEYKKKRKIDTCTRTIQLCYDEHEDLFTHETSNAKIL